MYMQIKNVSCKHSSTNPAISDPTISRQIETEKRRERIPREKEKESNKISFSIYPHPTICYRSYDVIVVNAFTHPTFLVPLVPFEFPRE